MRYWKCVSTPYCNLTVGKVYETDDLGNGLIDDNGSRHSNDDRIMDFKVSKFEEVKGEDEVEDLREMLKVGYVVKYRNGEFRMVMETEMGICFVNSNGYYLAKTDFDKNLKVISMCETFDIVEVYGFKCHYSDCLEVSSKYRKLIWKREEKSPTEIKLEELEKKQREIADEMEKLRKEL